MEVCVEEHQNVPSDTIVSVRCGTTRRQAYLDSVLGQSMRFPTSPDRNSEPLKIEVLQVIASARLVLHAHDEFYRIGLKPMCTSEHTPPTQSDMEVGVSVKCCAQMGGGVDGRDKSPSRGQNGPFAGKLQEEAASAEAVKEYLDRHDVMRYIQGLLHAIVQVKPADPYAFMKEQLRAAQGRSSKVDVNEIVSSPSLFPEQAAPCEGLVVEQPKILPPREEAEEQTVVRQNERFCTIEDRFGRRLKQIRSEPPVERDLGLDTGFSRATTLDPNAESLKVLSDGDLPSCVSDQLGKSRGWRKHRAVSFNFNKSEVRYIPNLSPRRKDNEEKEAAVGKQERGKVTDEGQRPVAVRLPVHPRLPAIARQAKLELDRLKDEPPGELSMTAIKSV